MIQSITYLTGISTEKNQLDAFLDQWFSPGKTVTIRTSGSTGTPKLIELSKDHMRISARATLDYFSIQKGGNALLCLSLTTIGGVMMVVRSIERSMNLIVAPVQSQPITDLNNQLVIDLAAMVPTQVHQLVAEKPEALLSIRTLLVGGAPVTTQLIEKLNSINYTAYQTFGMTETISHVAVRKIGKETDDYYEALPHIQFSENDHQLVIHYPSISTNPIQTKEHIELIDEYHFNWLGRTDLVINSGGKKIIPEAIEEKLGRFISKPFIVAGIPDDYWGEMVVLVVATRNDPKLDKSQLTQVGLQGHELPKRVYYINELILLESGKVDRRSTLNQLKRDEYTELL
jgi:O-succinylbenzoic acid--CoA ligase